MQVYTQFLRSTHSHHVEHGSINTAAENELLNSYISEKWLLMCVHFPVVLPGNLFPTSENYDT